MLAVDLRLEREHRVEVDRVGETPSRSAALWIRSSRSCSSCAARDHLALQLGHLHEHGLDVLVADRGGLLDHDPEQPARRLDLLVEVGEDRRSLAAPLHRE